MRNARTIEATHEITDKESVELDFIHLDEMTDKILKHSGDSEMVSALVDRAWDDIMSMKHTALKAIAERDTLIKWICNVGPESDKRLGCLALNAFEEDAQRNSKLKEASGYSREGVNYADVSL